MSTTLDARPVYSPKAEMVRALEAEHAITMRVLRAYPPDRLDVRPHPKSKNAGELLQLFAWEPEFAAQGLTTGIDWSAGEPEATLSPDEVIRRAEEGHRRLLEVVGGMPEEQLFDTIPFPTAPGTLSPISKLEFLRALLCDQIHHRGQLSVYLRLADAKVPSIYGPSADEPW